jgi:hypothetical protein
MNINYDTLLERVGHYLFGVRSFSSDQTADILDCIRDGLNRVYSAHDWSFFKPVVDLATVAPYATGTITVAAGVVTLTGGTFPSWAATGILRVRSSYYSVRSRDSGTQLTLESDSASVATASDYVLAQPLIELPAAFDAISGKSDLTYHPSEDMWFPPIRQRDDQTLRKLEQGNPEFGRPIFYAVRTAMFDPTVGSRRVLAVYPTPDEAYTFRVPMILKRTMVDSVNQYPIGGEVLGQAVLEACLASAEHNFEEREHVHERRFQEAIGLAIRNDQDRSSPTALGPDAPRDRYGRFSVFDYDYHAREQRIGRLTYGGDVL